MFKRMMYALMMTLLGVALSAVAFVGLMFATNVNVTCVHNDAEMGTIAGLVYKTTGYDLHEDAHSFNPFCVECWKGN